LTISSETRKAGPYTGNGLTTSFSFAFKVFTTADVLVVRTDLSLFETVLTLNTDYSVTLNSNQDSNPGGTVVLPTALTTGYLLTLSSQVGALQSTDLTNQGGFYPSVLNTALDKLTILVQQLKEQVGRAVKTDISSSVTPAQLIATLTTNAANAVASAASAATSAANALASQVAAAASAAAALVSQNSASSSASSASASASTATTQAALATTNGATQVSLATTQANNSATSATNSANSATAAAASAAAALTSKNNAATSETNAGNSATAAAGSATSAASSATSAAASAAYAATVFSYKMSVLLRGASSTLVQLTGSVLPVFNRSGGTINVNLTT
jgi:chemotaxis protein histidine kinase CheA